VKAMGLEAADFASLRKQLVKLRSNLLVDTPTRS
jgi:hypothetical protein